MKQEDDSHKGSHYNPMHLKDGEVKSCPAMMIGPTDILAGPCFEDAAARVTEDAVAKDTSDSMSPTSTDDPVELVKAVVDAEEEEQNQLLIAAMLAADKAEDEEEQEDLQAASARSEEADARSSKGAVAAVDAGCFCKVRLA
jgi:hypothetical protein